jgi:L-malate glycosyltransferase
MKVLHIISGGEAGGSKNHLLTLANSMNSDEIKIIIVCLMEGELYREALDMGLDIRLLKQKIRGDITIVNKLRKLCLEEDVDIINCHGGRANFLGFFLKIRYEAKYVSTIHSDYKQDYLGNIFKTIIFSNINRFVLRVFDNYITVSDNFKDMLVERGFKLEKIHVVYNGMDFEDDIEEFSRGDIIMENGIMGAEHYVSMIGRFHPVKGHTVFLDACKRVLEKFQNVIFILVGDGELKPELKKYAEDLGIGNKVYFAGFKKPDEYIFISDFTVVASYTESFPLVILESAFYEKTVVSTEVGGINKLIHNGENGYLVKPGDSEVLAEKMLTLLKDDNLSYEFGKRLYENARSNFSIENMVNNYIRIYKDIDGGIYI